MKNARGHLRGAVRVEGIKAPVRFDGDLFFEHELAVDAPGAAAVEDAVEDCHRVPIGRFARGRGVADGQRRKSAEWLGNFTAAFLCLRRLGNIGAGRHGAARNVVEVALGEDEGFGRVEIAKHKENGVVG